MESGEAELGEVGRSERISERARWGGGVGRGMPGWGEKGRGEMWRGEVRRGEVSEPR